jgi:bacteriorhodopsin
MIMTAVMFIAASYCDDILKFLFFALGYIGMDIYAYIMYKSNKNK